MTELVTKDYKRDTKSGALINKNREQYLKYKATKLQLNSAKEMCEEINSIKEDIKELKQLVVLLMDRTQ
jgi:hypothetical protein